MRSRLRSAQGEFSWSQGPPLLSRACSGIPACLRQEQGLGVPEDLGSVWSNWPGCSQAGLRVASGLREEGMEEAMEEA
jgi:hypothetical protein